MAEHSSIESNPTLQETEALRNHWYKEAQFHEMTVTRMTAMIFAVEKVMEDNPVFDREPTCSPEYVLQQADALHTSIRQLSKFAEEYEATSTARHAFRQWERADDSFNADLKAVEAKHKGKIGEAYEKDLKTVEERHEKPMADAFEALFKAPSTSSEAIRLKVRASLRGRGSECPLIKSIAA